MKKKDTRIQIKKTHNVTPGTSFVCSYFTQIGHEIGMHQPGGLAKISHGGSLVF